MVGRKRCDRMSFEGIGCGQEVVCTHCMIISECSVRVYLCVCVCVCECLCW